MRQLIRLHRWELDEKRQRLAEFELLESRLLDDLKRLEGDMENEAAIAESSPESALAYPGFVAAALKRRENLRNSIHEIEARIIEAREEVTQAFQEVKRFELALEKQLGREQELHRRREQSQMDDHAAEGFRRRAG
jgi:flagellar export protein FliJ